MSEAKRGSRRRANTRGGAPKKTRLDSKKKLTPAQAKLLQKEREGRRLAGLEEARKAQAALEARIAREQALPPRGRVPGAEWRAPVIEVPAFTEVEAVVPRQRVRRAIPADAQGNGKWTLGQARSMLRSGYHINKVVRITGFGINAFLDMKIDDDGYGLPLTE